MLRGLVSPTVVVLSGPPPDAEAPFIEISEATQEAGHGRVVSVMRILQQLSLDRD